MAGKITFALGLGAGYVLGTRAGRAQYERIKSTAARLAEQPAVRQRVDAAQARATSFARQRGEALTDKVADAVKDRLFGRPSAPTDPASSPTAVHVNDATVRPVS